MAKQQRRVRQAKTRAAENAMWNQNDAVVPIRELDDRHLMNTLHFVERKLAEYDRAYPHLLREARFRGLLVRR